MTFTDDETRWMKFARCVGYDVNLFYPEGIEETRTLKVISQDMESFCGQCRVKNECFEFAMKHDDIGIWGGTTGYTRTQLKKNSHKALCPGCRSDDIFTEYDDTCICNACGLSWT